MAARRKRLEKACKQCGKLFSRIPSLASKTTYCSYDCARVAKQTGDRVNCDFCGQEFHVSRARRAAKRGRFCSLSCYRALAARQKAQREAGGKVCVACGERKSIEEFHITGKPNSLGQRYRNSECKVCHYQRTKRSRGANPEIWGRYGFKRSLQARYGITVEQYEAMRLAQNNRCAICGSIPSGRGPQGNLHVDHDHETGQVRGLLCGRCNTGLGQFRHDSRFLQKAAEYLYLAARRDSMEEAA